MKLKSTEKFVCYPDGDNPLDVDAGKEFEIEDQEYADLLIKKGHAKKAAGEKPAPVPAHVQKKGEV